MNFQRAMVSAIVGFAALFSTGLPASAATAPALGTATSFAVLGGSTVTNTGATTLTGNLGVWPGLAITGFPPGSVTGVTHAGDAVALQAQSDVTTAYNDLAGQACNTDLTGQGLGGLTLVPGVYCFSTSAQLTGTLTLDAQGVSGAVWVFQIGSTLTTASNAAVLMANSGNSCNVFWQVGSSATLGTGTLFAGNILALTSISLNTGATMTGRALARNGAVTLDTNDVSASPCAGVCPPLTILPATLPAAVVGVPYSQPITAAGSTPDTYIYTVSAGTLPPGLALVPVTPPAVKSVDLAGTPTTAGSYSFTITATDANGCQVSQAYTMLVNPVACPTITVLPATLPPAVMGVPYSQVISATGGSGLYIFSVSAGALPPGLTLTPGTPTATALLSGTPTTSGTYNFTITATDENGCPGSQSYSMSLGVPPEGIPTLPGWAMIVMAAILGAVGFVALRGFSTS